MAKIERDPVEDKVKESEIFVYLFRERERETERWVVWGLSGFCGEFLSSCNCDEEKKMKTPK